MTENTNATATYIEKSKEVYDRIDALGPEDRNLVIDALLNKIVEQLNNDRAFANPAEIHVTRAILLQEAGLIGYTNARTGDDHEDWTKTGDRGVNRVLSDFFDIIKGVIQTAVGVVVNAEDLPDDTKKRLADGTPTAEDKALIEKLLKEQHPEIDTEDLDFDVAEVVGKPEQKDDPGYGGMYL